MSSNAIENGLKLAEIESSAGASGVGFIQSGTEAVATTVQTKLRETVSVKDFGAVGDGVTDDYAAFAAAIAVSKRVYVPNPSVKYCISRPLVLDDDQQLIGESRETCIIEKTTTNGPSPALGIVSGTRGGVAFNYDYDKNAVVIIKKPAARAYPNNIGIHNITLQGKSGVTVEYGVYAPRLARSRFTQVTINVVTNGWFTYDSWMCTFEGVECKYISYGFRWENDGTGTGSGTSCTFIGCFANIADVYGWYLYGLVYSSIVSCASESIVSAVAGNRPAAWFFNLCKGLTVNGCGSEVVKGFTFRISGGSVDIRGGRFDGLTGDTFGSSTAVVYLDNGAKVAIGGGARFEAVTSPGNLYNEFVSGAGSRLEYDGTVTRPSGATTAFTGSGGFIVDPSTPTTFTPTIVGSTTAGSATYSTQEGYYTRIGNVVYYSISLAWTGGTGTGNLYIGGLPFTSKAIINYVQGNVQPGSTLTVSASKVAAAQVIPNSTQLRVIEVPVGTGTVGLCAYDTDASIFVTGFYFV
jgi:Pectate lyase superfamily protein